MARLRTGGRFRALVLCGIVFLLALLALPWIGAESLHVSEALSVVRGEQTVHGLILFQRRVLLRAFGLSRCDAHSVRNRAPRRTPSFVVGGRVSTFISVWWRVMGYCDQNAW
ncbi:hypothetical protein JXA88_01400 [Candidatus Fermentibacteria bacterium]|nr:hypothetical protein [Candidatus Fermentibacteria bacterium]